MATADAAEYLAELVCPLSRAMCCRREDTPCPGSMRAEAVIAALATAPEPIRSAVRRMLGGNQ